MQNNYRIISFAACLIPLLWICWSALNNQVGNKPVEAVSQLTGIWTLSFLLIVLAITPLNKILGWSSLVRYRRMLGLFVFFYACVHFSNYFLLDRGLDIAGTAKDIAKRPFIALGFFAFLLTIPLAITSTNRMKKRLGKKWKLLHQLVYLIGLLGVLHYLWLVKKDFVQPILYASIFLILMMIRVWCRLSFEKKPAATVKPDLVN